MTTTNLVKIKTWSFDSDKKALTLDVVPVEFYEGAVLKKFADVTEDLSVEKVGKELSTGLYLEVLGQAPSNNYVCMPCPGAGMRSCFYLAANGRLERGCMMMKDDD